MKHIFPPDDVMPQLYLCEKMLANVGSDDNNAAAIPLPEDVGSDDNNAAAVEVDTRTRQTPPLWMPRSTHVQAKHFDGLSRWEIMDGTVVVPHRVPWLWNAPAVVRHTEHDDLMEIYSQPRVIPAARLRGLRADLACDLLTGWNLSCPAVRMQVVGDVKGRQPTVLIMSPPCTFHCHLMGLSWWRMRRDYRERGFREHHSHVEFCMLLADMQMEENDFSSSRLLGQRFRISLHVAKQLRNNQTL